MSRSDEEALDELAREIVSALREGDGEHTEQLDRNIIKGKVRAYCQHLAFVGQDLPPHVSISCRGNRHSRCHGNRCQCKCHGR